MAASGVAFAASNITLYGDVDTSAVLTHDGGASDSKNVIDMQSGFLNGSRWGIKGVEELGNGYAVGSILEMASTPMMELTVRNTVVGSLVKPNSTSTVDSVRLVSAD